MANRLYLYTCNDDFSTIRDVSEWPWVAPTHLFYSILLSEFPTPTQSMIWEYEEPISITSQFEPGLKRYLDFLQYLSTQEGINQAQIKEYIQDTNTFWEEHPDRRNKFFLLEGGEIYELDHDSNPMETQNADAVQVSKARGELIQEILDTKPADLRAFTDATWVHELFDDCTPLSPYWTKVTYFSFNSTPTQ